MNLIGRKSIFLLTSCPSSVERPFFVVRPAKTGPFYIPVLDTLGPIVFESKPLEKKPLGGQKRRSASEQSIKSKREREYPFDRFESLKPRQKFDDQRGLKFIVLPFDYLGIFQRHSIKTETKDVVLDVFFWF